MKVCTFCKIEKPLSEFNKNKSRKDGHSTFCRECGHEKFKEYYHANKHKHTDYVSKRNKREKSVVHANLLEFLKNSECMDCGNKDIRVLEFDHRPTEIKSKDVSAMITARNKWDKILVEINKCDVVCANCHKIRTYERCGSYRCKMPL